MITLAKKIVPHPFQVKLIKQIQFQIINKFTKLIVKYLKKCKINIKLDNL